MVINLIWFDLICSESLDYFSQYCGFLYESNRNMMPIIVNVKDQLFNEGIPYSYYVVWHVLVTIL